MNNYRRTKYNPQLRVNGKYLLDEWTSISDIGKIISNREFTMKEYERVEQSYISFIFRVLSICDIKALTINQLENRNRLKWSNKQLLNISQIKLFVKDCLREKCWGKLETNNFYIHFGYDYYMYIGTNIERNIIQEIALKFELYVEDYKSPYLN